MVVTKNNMLVSRMVEEHPKLIAMVCALLAQVGGEAKVPVKDLHAHEHDSISTEVKDDVVYITLTRSNVPPGAFLSPETEDIV